jgi:hypothetical protein
MTDDLTHDVLIVDPTHTLTIFGPMTENAAKSLAIGLMRGDAPDGTEINVLDHHPYACTHDLFDRDDWRDPERVADMVEAETAPPMFPSTHDVLVALNGGTWAGSGWEKATGLMLARDADREQDEQITANVAALVTRTQAAATALGNVEQVVNDLVRYYDVEIAEGWDEADLRHEIEVAARALRSIERIAQIRAAKEG